MDDEKALLFIREEIDSIDSAIDIFIRVSFEPFSRNRKDKKKRMDKDLLDESRESEILKKIDELALIYPKEDLKSIFLEIMKTSLKQQKSND